jgi:hypothetical protein
MWKMIRISWNILLFLAILREGIVFDYYHFRRVGWFLFRKSQVDRWDFSNNERQALTRFVLWTSLLLTGNAVISFLQWLQEMSR